MEKTPTFTLLLGPAPCDRCRWAEHCRDTGEACRAFAAFVDARNFDFEPREPRADVARRLGLRRNLTVPSTASL